MEIWKMVAELDIEKQLQGGTSRIPKGNLNLVNILNWVYVVMGTVAVVVIIYNGVQFLGANGEPGKVQKAIRGMIYAGIGLGVIGMAAVITNFVFGTITSNVQG